MQKAPPQTHDYVKTGAGYCGHLGPDGVECGLPKSNARHAPGPKVVVPEQRTTARPTPISSAGVPIGLNSPLTSYAAAEVASVRAGSTRARIVAAVASAPNGLTDAELERHLEVKHETVSSARNWLMNNGWLAPGTTPDGVPAKRPVNADGTGSLATVWVLTAAGRQAAS